MVFMIPATEWRRFPGLRPVGTFRRFGRQQYLRGDPVAIYGVIANSNLHPVFQGRKVYFLRNGENPAIVQNDLVGLPVKKRDPAGRLRRPRATPNGKQGQ